jgi:hypothetical protein
MAQDILCHWQVQFLSSLVDEPIKLYVAIVFLITMSDLFTRMNMQKQSTSLECLCQSVGNSCFPAFHLLKESKHSGIAERAPLRPAPLCPLLKIPVS